MAAAVSAYLEASDVQDETLMSIARLMETNQMGAPREPELFDDEHLDNSAVSVWEMSMTSRHGLSIQKTLKNGFHTLHENDDFWRVYVTQKNRSGQQFIVAQTH
ncbi:MAG: hypothetical protein AB8B64_25285 [Granulosicoccus sp.]